MKYIAILGSTGSIGCNTLNVIRHLHSQFQVVALAAKENIDLLEQQAHEFHPALIAVYDLQKAQELQKRLPHIPIIPGMEGLRAVATIAQATMVISAMSGTIGLQPTIEAIQSGKNIGLANKEILVSGGSLIMQLVEKHRIEFIPIDSEHSAIFQCLRGEKHQHVRRIILTTSGGPFRTWTPEECEHATLEQALKHPTWKMGAKVTIDSSTLMNKGLEVIEAFWLFNQDIDKIEVVVHPQSVIHGLVEFQDGSLLAQLGDPNMIVPIQYALTYPERSLSMLQYFDFTQHPVLEFFKPNLKQFRCLALAYEATRQGGSFPCYLNAANETFVESFLAGQIRWSEIAHHLENLMHRHIRQPVDTLESILEIDKIARLEASQCLVKRN